MKKKFYYIISATLIVMASAIATKSFIDLSNENKMLQDRYEILTDSIRLQNENIEMYKADTLSEWEMFQMALMWVESGYNTNAVSPTGAKGAYQITSIYIKEVNNNHGTNYVPEDAFDFEKSHDIFHKMQETHNPELDMGRAIELHNSGNGWYAAKVKSSMEIVKLYEGMRKRLKSRRDSI